MTNRAPRGEKRAPLDGLFDLNPLILGSRPHLHTYVHTYKYLHLFFIYIINTFQGYDALDHNKFIYIEVCVCGREIGV